MNKFALDKGRVNQKLKTRDAILQAAKSLMTKKKKINLEDVAEQAGISRATVYRYFSNIDLLFLEATLDFEHLSADEIAEQVKDLPLKQGVLFIQNYYNTLALKNETVFRRYLSSALAESVNSKKKLRGSRRVSSLQKSLVPFKDELGKDNFNKLINIASVLMGIDALIVTKDVCNMNEADGNKLLTWALDAIIDSLTKAS